MSTSLHTIHKAAGALVPRSQNNESALLTVAGRLLLFTFNRPPLVQEVIVRDVSDLRHPIILARFAWAGAMGDALVDANGVVHIYGASPPAALNSSIIHSTLDANWNPSAPNTVVGPSGVLFGNIAVAAGPGVYVLANEHQYTTGGKDETYISSPTPDFAAYTITGSAPVDFTGKSRIRFNTADGYYYITSDSALGNTRIARTKTLQTGSFVVSPTIVFGPDYSGEPYDGNVSWDEIGGQTIACYMLSDEITFSELHSAIYPGTLSSFFSEFF